MFMLHILFFLIHILCIFLFKSINCKSVAEVWLWLFFIFYLKNHCILSLLSTLPWGGRRLVKLLMQFFPCHPPPIFILAERNNLNLNFTLNSQQKKIRHTAKELALDHNKCPLLQHSTVLRNSIFFSHIISLLQKDCKRTIVTRYT